MKKFTLYNQRKFQGKTVQFTESVTCIDTLNFQLLQMYGIKILSDPNSNAARQISARRTLLRAQGAAHRRQHLDAQVE